MPLDFTPQPVKPACLVWLDKYLASDEGQAMLRHREERAAKRARLPDRDMSIFRRRSFTQAGRP